MKNQINCIFLSIPLLLLISVFPSAGQENYVSKVEKEIIEDVMHITYDIVPAENVRFFYVILEALSNGQKISIKEAYGNVGHRQQAGKNEVVWYFKKDFEGDITRVVMNVYAFKENEPRALAKVVSISNNGMAPCEVVFANNSKYANQYEWDFGDVESGMANHSIEENPVHLYSRSGIYTTQLTARNTDIGMEEIWVYTLEIKPPAPPEPPAEEIKPPVVPEQKEVKEEVIKPVPEIVPEPVTKEEAPVVEPVVKKPVSLAQKHKSLKMVWLGSAVATAGVGTITWLNANSAYDKYTKSVDNAEAEQLRKKFKSNDAIYPVAFVLSGLCISQVILQAGKQKKASGGLGLEVVPLEKGGSVILTLNF